MIVYRHTQVGWVIIATAIFVLLVTTPAMIGVGQGVLLFPLAIAVAIALLFGTLTVALDQERLSLRFGVGLIRKSIPVSDIRWFAPVRNPWYYGWGIRLTPVGRLYNVSGFDAVDLLLNNGRHIRVGTDEPAALLAALTHRLGMPAPLPIDHRVERRSANRRLVAVLLVGAVVLCAFVAALLYVGLQPPIVGFSSTTFSVRGAGFYGVDLPYAQISEVSLQDSIPRIVRKTNGFNAGNILRGRFRLDVLGEGQIFINRGVPPYVILKTPGSFVIINFENSERTRELYAALRRRVPAK